MITRAAVLLLCTLPLTAANAWVPTGHRYAAAEITLSLSDLCDTVRFPATPGTCAGSPANPDWAAEFTTAMGRWNSATLLFEFKSDPTAGASTPGSCLHTDPSSSFFLPDVCGSAFGASTLAVARTISTSGGMAIHSDVIFNSTKTWGAFDGALASMPGVSDFRRVAVHELGHVAGLSHPFHSDAIMYAFVQDAISPLADDLNGISSKYGAFGFAVSTDTSGDGVDELVVVRSLVDGTIRAEVRDGAAGALLRNMDFLNSSFRAVGPPVVLPDLDGNGRPELAVLARRISDGRALVEIRNLAGAETPRVIWFASAVTPIRMIAAGDTDSNGVAEVAVLSTRDSDDRSLVEVKNAFGATLPRTLWYMSFATPLDVAVIPDADSNGIVEIAVLSRRFSDDRGVVEIKNALGMTLPNAVWTMPGVKAEALAVVPDADANGVPEVAILSRRNSDGRIVVEVKNAAGATLPNTLWFAAGHRAYGLSSVSDADGNGKPEVAVVSRRDSDGRVVVELKNASGPTEPVSLWYSPGFGVAPLVQAGTDLDSNGALELSLLMSRLADGRVVVQVRNGSGAVSPKNVWLSP